MNGIQGVDGSTPFTSTKLSEEPPGLGGFSRFRDLCRRIPSTGGNPVHSIHGLAELDEDLVLRIQADQPETRIIEIENEIESCR